MFETETEYTYAEYKKLQNFLFKRELYKGLIIALLGFLIVLRANNINFYIAYIGMLIIFVLSVFINRSIKLKIGWKINNTTEKMHNKYTFDKHHFEEKNEISNSYINYKDIMRIIESKTNVYISSSRNTWYILKKDNCSQELLEFIRNYKQHI